VSAYTKNPMLRRSLEGIALGAGVSAIKLLWSNVLMPMLAPKDGDVEKLKANYIARLYPAEVAAKLNLATMSTTGSLSGASESGVGKPDVGPFALAGSSPYPDASQALRREAGIGGDSPYPSAGQALTAGVGAMPYGSQPGVGYAYRRPAAPAVNQWRGMHPGYQRGAALSQRWGGAYQSQYQLPTGYHHHHCMARARVAYPNYSDAQLHAFCQTHPYSTQSYLYEAPQTVQYGAVSDPPDSPDPGGPGFTPAGPPPAPQAPVAAVPMPDPVGPSVGPGPGPVPLNQECGCIGDNNAYLGFIGDAEEKDLFFSTGK